MRNIYFVRHSIRDFVEKEDAKVQLTEEGSVLADSLKHYFIDKEITEIFSSPYLRTMATIEPTAYYLGLEINEVFDFRERCVGNWVEDFEAYSKVSWENFDYQNSNGESLNQVLERVSSAFEHVLRCSKGNIIICGHGTALAVLFNKITTGNFQLQELQKMTMPDIYFAACDSKGKVHSFQRCYRDVDKNTG